MTARALIIGAARSGSGKTSVTIGLMRALRRRGLAVHGAKSGPDYIDPGFHLAATGHPGVNLDSWAMHPDLLAHLLGAQAAEADMLLVESAMGLFDGIVSEPGRSGAAADIARRHGVPCLVILDVTGQSQTAAALAKGFAAYDPTVKIAGVVLNQVASARHETMAREAIEAIGIKVLGAVHRNPDMALPERHLGLVQASEHEALEAFIERLADVMEQSVDLDAVMEIAAPLGAHCGAIAYGGAVPPPLTPPLKGEGSDEAHHLSSLPSEGRDRGWGSQAKPAKRVLCDCPGTHRGAAGHMLPPPGQRIAIARDRAFSFVYPHLAAHWQAQGAALLPFSPLADEGPDPSADACWLPGGYPELHVEALANARAFQARMRAFAQTRPVHGECGGFMVLGRALEDAEGNTHPMLGLLDHVTSYAKRKMNLGYRQARLLADSPIGAAGETIRGHEFHYSRLIEPGADAPLAELADGQGRALGPAGARRGHVSGTYFHAIARG
ncbi:cobyrinate a,c-diamide synthase [Nitratireductor sp. ZSWI3]|uniref:cobyrinate a,c-diamide synthase n=1 Tax=Nitratireductor sp. ZSWI3 TaxID=2966359 RepID=UPI0021500DAB|nr:cobyrinate a,c-diamide synthase [Nitratireductor sp. ZSWI3]MCR4269433.1 cobyrinate a,c-diamide synthase [Nitratireductor sp. ZSWI3]